MRIACQGKVRRRSPGNSIIFLVEKDNPCVGSRGALFPFRVCKDQSSLGVSRHELQALFRKPRIERQVSSAAFEDREKADDGIEGAIKIHTDQAPKTGPLLTKEVSKAIRAGVQLAVRDSIWAHRQRSGFGSALGLGFNELIWAKGQGVVGPVILEWRHDPYSHPGAITDNLFSVLQAHAGVLVILKALVEIYHDKSTAYGSADLHRKGEDGESMCVRLRQNLSCSGRGKHDIRK